MLRSVSGHETLAPVPLPRADCMSCVSSVSHLHHKTHHNYMELVSSANPEMIEIHFLALPSIVQILWSCP